MSKSPSLRDVARHAGVSLGTTSRALNNRNNVLPETRSRVLRAASELGYKLQFRSPTAVSTKLNTIGVIIKRDPVVTSKIDPFNYGLLCGIEEECRRLGISMMFSTIPVDEFSHVTEPSPIPDSSAVDGLVIVGAIINGKSLSAAISPNIPVVLVDACTYDGSFDSVLIDNFDGAYKAVSYLIKQGHTAIGLIGSSTQATEHPSIRDRRRGYLQALADHGIERSYIGESSLHSPVAQEAARKLLTEHPEVTAIFACNDQIAGDIIRLAESMGRRVPDELSICGFDDLDLAARITPQLTTIQVDRSLMGTLAVRRLYDRAAMLDRVPVQTIVGTRLIERQSVSSPADKSLRANGQRGKAR